MDLTKPEETKKLLDAILKADKTLTLDSPEVRALDGKTPLETKETNTKQPVMKAKSDRTRVNEMFERAGKGDVDFDAPTKEEQKAIAKAYFKSQEPEPQAIDPDIIHKLFARAKKGEE